MSDVSEILLDKLAERVAFERTGAKIYQALISKYEDAEDKRILPELARLERFQQEEAKHFEIVSDVMARIGGEYPVITPTTDLSGGLSMGWMLSITDPCTTFLQALEIVLQAELVDHAAWEVLIELAEKRDLPGIATEFQECLNEKAVHISTLKQWVVDLTLNQEVQEAESKLSFMIKGDSKTKH